MLLLNRVFTCKFSMFLWSHQIRNDKNVVYFETNINNNYQFFFCFFRFFKNVFFFGKCYCQKHKKIGKTNVIQNKILFNEKELLYEKHFTRTNDCLRYLCYLRKNKKSKVFDRPFLLGKYGF